MRPVFALVAGDPAVPNYPPTQSVGRPRRYTGPVCEPARLRWKSHKLIPIVKGESVTALTESQIAVLVFEESIGQLAGFR